MGAHVPLPVYQESLDQRLAFEGEQCTACEEISFPPTPTCRHCLSNDEFESVTLSGEGIVYSYTVISPGSAPPEFAPQAAASGQYVVAVIELDEGPRITAQLTDIEPNEVEIGLPVTGCVRRLYEEEDVVRYGFKFQPE
ncbi:Zn-ribbon domain-containing OB-fold protein [Natrialbaceae archaeon A-CW2]